MTETTDSRKTMTILAQKLRMTVTSANGFQEAVLSAMNDLTERERAILEKRCGFGGRVYTLQEIANELGISRERVRQIEVRALRRLRHPRYGLYHHILAVQSLTEE